MPRLYLHVERGVARSTDSASFFGGGSDMSQLWGLGPRSGGRTLMSNYPGQVRSQVRDLQYAADPILGRCSPQYGGKSRWATISGMQWGEQGRCGGSEQKRSLALSAPPAIPTLRLRAWLACPKIPAGGSGPSGPSVASLCGSLSGRGFRSAWC